MGDAAARHTPPPHEAKPQSTTHHGEPDGLPTPAGAASGGWRLQQPSLAAGNGDAAALWRKGADAKAHVTSFSLGVSPAAGGARGGGAAAETFPASLRGGGAAAETFLASLCDARLPGALLGAAVAAPPAAPEPVKHVAAANGVVMPAFASQPAPDANATAAVVESMLSELNACGWLGQRSGLDADAVERLRGEFRPGAAASALHDFACRVRRSARREIKGSMSKVCISLAKEFSQTFQDEFIKQRITRADVAVDVAPFAPPGAVQPALPADESDQAGALAAYRAAGWIGPGRQRISSSMFATLTRWRGDPRTTVRALRRLPYIAAADLAAGCPLSACVFEESKAEFYKTRGGVAALEKSRAGQQQSMRQRFHLAGRERVAEESKPRWRDAQPRGRSSPEPRGRSRDLRDVLPRRRSYSREARGRSRERRSYRRSRSRSNGWCRNARGRSRERRSRSRDGTRRSRSVSRSFGRRERGRSAAQHAPQHAPASNPLAVLSGLEVPAYHYRNPRTGVMEAASPLSLFREGVVSGRIPLATAATTLIWRAGTQECTAAPLALILAAQHE